MDENFNDSLEDEGTFMGAEWPIVASAVTPKYVIFQLTKTWGQARQVVANDRNFSGASFTPPVGHQIKIAFERPGKEEVEEELESDVLTFNELLSILKQQAVMHQVLLDPDADLLETLRLGLLFPKDDSEF